MGQEAHSKRRPDQDALIPSHRVPFRFNCPHAGLQNPNDSKLFWGTLREFEASGWTPEVKTNFLYLIRNRRAIIAKYYYLALQFRHLGVRPETILRRMLLVFKNEDCKEYTSARRYILFSIITWMDIPDAIMKDAHPYLWRVRDGEKDLFSFMMNTVETMNENMALAKAFHYLVSVDRQKKERAWETCYPDASRGGLCSSNGLTKWFQAASLLQKHGWVGEVDRVMRYLRDEVRVVLAKYLICLHEQCEQRPIDALRTVLDLFRKEDTSSLTDPRRAVMRSISRSMYLEDVRLDSPDAHRLYEITGREADDVFRALVQMDRSDDETKLLLKMLREALADPRDACREVTLGQKLKTTPVWLASHGLVSSFSPKMARWWLCSLRDWTQKDKAGTYTAAYKAMAASLVKRIDPDRSALREEGVQEPMRWILQYPDLVFWALVENRWQLENEDFLLPLFRLAVEKKPRRLRLVGSKSSRWLEPWPAVLEDMSWVLVDIGSWISKFRRIWSL